MSAFVVETIRCLRLNLLLPVFCFCGPAWADSLEYGFEGDVLPHDPTGGWSISNACEDPCSEGVSNGSFFFFWPTPGDFAVYTHFIVEDPAPPPPSLWVEWRFRSNHPLGQNSFGCDARIVVLYKNINSVLNMYGDAAISFSGNDSITGLDIEEFHTYRFESTDGTGFRISVDGDTFIQSTDNQPSVNALQIIGRGGCGGDEIPNQLHEWDYVRYGTISSGEQIVSGFPPPGYVDPEIYGSVDRFTVTFDSPNYVYIDEITVTATGGVDPPVVHQTHRGDEFAPDTVEIVLDRPLPADQETRFTFDDGATVNEVVYTLIEPPPIPTTSAWGMVTLVLLVSVTATVILRPCVILKLLHKSR